MTNPTPDIPILDDDAVAELADRDIVMDGWHEPTVILTPDERDALCATVRALRDLNKGLAKDNVNLTNETHKAADRWQSELRQTEARLKTITEDRNLLYTQTKDLQSQLEQAAKERDQLRRQLSDVVTEHI